MRQWCRQNNVKLIKGNDGEQGCGIADIQEVMSANLPRDFRWMDKGKGLKYSGALCVTQRNQLHETRGTYRGVIELMIHGQIRDGRVVGDEKKAVGPLATMHRSVLFPRDEFARLKVPTAHRSAYSGNRLRPPMRSVGSSSKLCCQHDRW